MRYFEVGATSAPPRNASSASSGTDTSRAPASMTVLAPAKRGSGSGGRAPMMMTNPASRRAGRDVSEVEASSIDSNVRHEFTAALALALESLILASALGFC